MAALDGFQTENRIVFETVQPGFEHGVEQSVLSGPGLQLLDPGPRDAYQHRLHDTEGAISEVFQANARWRQCDLDAAPTEEEQQELRAWFLASGRKYRPVEGDRSGIQLPLRAVPPPVAGALAMLASIGVEAEILYASDVVVVWNGHSWLLPAGGEQLVRMRRIHPEGLAELTRAVPEGKRKAFTAAPMLLSLTTVPWRIEMAQGPRGYRVALQQAGLLLAATMQVLSRAGADPVATTEFADVVVDRVLDQDGVERFTTALIAVRPSGAQSPSSRPGGGDQ